MMKLTALADLAALVKLAAEELDRPIPNIPLAKGTLMTILGRLKGEDISAPDVTEIRAKNIPAAAVDMGISAKQLRMLIKRGDLDEAIVRTGTSMRGVRVIVPRALEALKDGVVGRGPKDVAEREYESFRRREQMRLVAGGK